MLGQINKKWLIFGGLVAVIFVACCACSGISFLFVLGQTSEVAKTTRTVKPVGTVAPRPTVDIDTTAALATQALATVPAASIPTETPTPGPTDTPLPKDTPAPIDVPPVEPIILTGSGDSVIDTGKPNVQMLAVISGNQEGQNFAVIALDANGEQLDLLVNTTEVYAGVLPLDFKRDSLTTRFEVTAPGPWRIELQPITTAKQLQVPGEITGHGDDVIRLVGGVPDTAEISGNADGQLFAVLGFGSSSGLLVNTTDPYQGQIVIDADTLLLAVQAVGDWRINIKAR